MQDDIVTDHALASTGAVMRRYWPRSCAGLAVYAGRPVVVIDPVAPPPELALKGEGEAA